MIEVRIVEFRISKLFEILFDLPSSINLPLKREREIPSQIYWLINTVDGEIFDLPDTRLQRQRRNRKPIYMISIQFDSNFPPEVFVPLFAKLAQSCTRFSCTLRFTASLCYVRANKESHPANQDGQHGGKKKEVWRKRRRGRRRTSIPTSSRDNEGIAERSTYRYNPR